MSQQGEDTTIQRALSFALEHLVKARPPNPIEFVAEKLLEYKEMKAGVAFADEAVVVNEASEGDTTAESEGEWSESEEEPTEEEQSEDDGDDEANTRGLPPPSYFNRGRRQSVSAETFQKRFAYGDDAEVAARKKESKTGEQLARIESAIAKNFLFRDLEEDQKKDIFDAMFEVKHAAGEVIIQQGDEGDNFYVLDQGECDIYVSKARQAPVHVGTASPGDSFGELALMYYCPRAATVKAKTSAVLWAVDRFTFRKILMETTLHKRQRYESFLKKVDLLRTLNDYELMTLSDALSVINVPDGEAVVRQGDSGDSLYIVEKGEAVAYMSRTEDKESRPVMVKEYTEGGYFGEIALLTQEPRRATVVARGDLKCLQVDRACFNRLLGSCEKLLRRNMDLYASYGDVLERRATEKAQEKSFRK